MRIVRMPVLCRNCGQRWCADTVTDAAVRVVIASWQDLRCPDPKCRADWRRLSFDLTTPDAEPDRSAA